MIATAGSKANDPQAKPAYFDSAKLKAFDVDAFKVKEPFPWSNLQGFLTDEGFKTLYEDFPSLDLFEKHQGIKRATNQRPHNRYYLAYESSLYRQLENGPTSSNKGVAKLSQLPASWQAFIQEIETNAQYKGLIKSLFDVSDYQVRMAWHVGFDGCEVSPHVDSPDKIGTHILYFNTSQDWSADWGGEPLVLSGKQVEARNPEYEDFIGARAMKIMDNRSFLFKNAPDGWHGVKPLRCPEGSYRRLFNIIFEFSPKPDDKVAGLKALIPASLRSIARNVVR